MDIGEDTASLIHLVERIALSLDRLANAADELQGSNRDTPDRDLLAFGLMAEIGPNVSEIARRLKCSPKTLYRSQRFRKYLDIVSGRCGNPHEGGFRTTGGLDCEE